MTSCAVRVGGEAMALWFERVPNAGECIDLSYYDAAREKFGCAALFVLSVWWRPGWDSSVAILTCKQADPYEE